MAQVLVNYWIDGLYYSRDGTQRFSDALAGAFVRFGGELKVGAEVSEILT